MNATETGILPISRSLSIHAKKSHIFVVLHSASLISLSQICDDDYIVNLDKNIFNIIKDRKLILKGHRNNTYGSWDVLIPRPFRHHDHAIITRYKKKNITYSLSSWILLQPQSKNFPEGDKNGNFLTCPGLNNQQLCIIYLLVLQQL